MEINPSVSHVTERRIQFSQSLPRTLCGCHWFSENHGEDKHLARYVKLRFAQAPGMPGTFPCHRGLAIPTCFTARAWRTCRCCMPGSLTSGFPWSQWRGKRSRHSRCMHNPRIYVSGKRQIGITEMMCVNMAIKVGMQLVFLSFQRIGIWGVWIKFEISDFQTKYNDWWLWYLLWNRFHVVGTWTYW